MYSMPHIRCLQNFEKIVLRMPWWSSEMISPGRTSRMNYAPMMPNAQDSLLTT